MSVTSPSQTDALAPATPHIPIPKDHFIVRDGIEYAGTHIIIDLWQGKPFDDIAHMEQAMRDCITECGATLLHIHLHHFTPYAGISGVAVLAESHISVHTWPERQFAAFDVFMCGDAQPEKAIDILRKHFNPQHYEVRTCYRGGNNLGSGNNDEKL